MLRAVVRAFGEPRQAVGIEEAERIAPGPGEVEIRIRRAAINPSDLIPVTGAYRSRTTLPFVPGFEGVGEIVRMGDGVAEAYPPLACRPSPPQGGRSAGGWNPAHAASLKGRKTVPHPISPLVGEMAGRPEGGEPQTASRFFVGQRVLPIGASGLWQEYLVRPAEWCFAVPDDLSDDLSDDQAAMAYVNPLTAFRLVEAVSAHFGAADGRRVGVTAAASAIGKMLLALLADAGFRPVALVRSPATAARLREGFSGEIAVQSAPMLDAVLDAVGGAAGDALFRRIRSGGAFIQYGALSGAQLDPVLVSARREAVSFSFLWLRNWVHSAPRAAIEDAFARSFSGIRAGVLGSAIDGVFPLSELAAALARQEDPARKGKLLLAP
ncbi:zinc-dependent alcohol dehydrogenase family protein [Shinella fusca]|uniref:NADPH:quinone reductase-like Zn-dependent oxidoreductase n=1 Tax=Shinella fusca TaxID=544480 RepID=A0A7W7YYI5_9HYPH|nr:zinc-dependent alcohol dehydrogenase family protein [Shinella fusca]MBB5044709.1 NADPH:quinone reductase-like Zn-dependent oxidoreductase [Shinella fusca]